MLKNDGERMKKNRVYVGERSGTAVPLQARVVPTYWNVGFVLACEGTTVPLQARAVANFWHFRLKFFFFSVLLNRFRTITYKIT